MNRFSVLATLILFGSTAFSQTADKHSHSRVFSTADDSSNCPIEIRAKVEVGVEGPRGLQRIVSDQDNQQKLQITLKNFKSL